MNKFTVASYAQKDPNLFITANNRDEGWRMAEILVSVIESFLKGKDIGTVSSTRVVDIINYSEQIDVGQVRVEDPKKFFNFIEVRDKKSKVSRNYVQEVMGKRTSLGIPECEIVSTKEFTAPAKRLAAHEGINLRLFHPDNDPADTSWFQAETTILTLKEFRIDQCFLHVWIDDRYEDFESEFPEVIYKTLLLLDENQNPTAAVPLPLIFDNEVLTKPEADTRLFGSIEHDGLFHKLPPITVQFAKPHFFIRVEVDREGFPFNEGPKIVSVHAIQFLISTKVELHSSQIIGRYLYIDAISEKLLAKIALLRFNINEKSFHQAFVRFDFMDDSCKDGSVFFE